jgi:hypothetical protein
VRLCKLKIGEQFILGLVKNSTHSRCAETHADLGKSSQQIVTSSSSS